MSATRLAARALPLACLLVVGCQGDSKKAASRPKAGDTVIPVFALAEPWKAGTSTPVQAKFRAEGPSGTRYLQIGEMEDAHLPRLTVTYFQGETHLEGPREVQMAHDC